MSPPLTLADAARRSPGGFFHLTNHCLELSTAADARENSGAEQIFSVRERRQLLEVQSQPDYF